MQGKQPLLAVFSLSLSLFVPLSLFHPRIISIFPEIETACLVYIWVSIHKHDTHTTLESHFEIIGNYTCRNLQDFMLIQ